MITYVIHRQTVSLPDSQTEDLLSAHLTIQTTDSQPDANTNRQIDG